MGQSKIDQIDWKTTLIVSLTLAVTLQVLESKRSSFGQFYYILTCSQSRVHIYRAVYTMTSFKFTEQSTVHYFMSSYLVFE